MNLVARVVLFLMGLAVGGMILGVLELRLDGAWIPFAAGAAYCCLLAFMPWRPDGLFLVSHCGLVISGLVWAWLVQDPRRAAIGVDTGADEGSLVLTCVFAICSLVSLFTGPRDQRRQRWLLAVVTVMLMGLAFASGPLGSAGRMSGLIQRLFDLSPDQLDLVVIILRKVTHFLFYGLLARWSAQAALARGSAVQGALLYGFAVAAIFAGYDELRQTLEPSRTGSWWDVLLDLVGAAVLLCIPRLQKVVKSKKDSIR